MTFKNTASFSFTCLLLLCTLIQPAQACGPDFPNRYFDAPSAEIIAAPEAYFARELAKIAGVDTPSPKDSGGTDSDTQLDDLEELKSALEQAKLPREELETALSSYAQLRADLDTFSAQDLAEQLPQSIPAEFSLYLTGAHAYKQYDYEAARSAWETLLKLPEPERRHRSTWALFMLGRTADTPEAATELFRQLRHLPAEDFCDSQNLKDASWGWEAKSYLNQDCYVEAVNLYLRHYQAGAPSALNSLRMVLRRVLEKSTYAYPPDNPIMRFANDANARRIWTAYLLSLRTDRYYWDEYYKGNLMHACKQWVQILKEEGIASIDEYDHFAWIAYKSDYLDLAKEWLELAPGNCGTAPWIRAKIALREGDLIQAEISLETAAQSGELAKDRSVILAELGRVQLALDKPQKALHAWLQGRHWEDAAYIAERVLTADELIAFVDQQLERTLPASPTTQANGAENGFWVRSSELLRTELRSLLARRLMREDRFEEALSYFDSTGTPEAARYVSLLQSAFDAPKPAAQRAAHLWEAAQLARYHGMQLFATELYPDARIWGGNFSLADPTGLRRQLARYDPGILAPTPNEQERMQLNPSPDKRYHYRYLAAKLAGWAASLLPNDSEDTADILYTAGSWIKHRDPQAAEPFYQSLVVRCPNTPLGRAAAELHWFPEDKTDITPHRYEPEQDSL